MTDPAVTAQPNTDIEDEQTTPEPGDDAQGDPALADPGKKALAAERRARAAAEKQAKTLKDRLDAIEAATLSEQERDKKEAEAAKAEAQAAKAEALRWRIAARYRISDDDAELFLTATDEDTLIKQAERFVALTPGTPKGTPIPGVGNKPPTPPSIAEQIDAATASGDVKLALALKAAQVAELARNT